MKICNNNPAYGLVITDGARMTCEPGGYIEVGDERGKALMRQYKNIIEFGTVLPTPIEDEQPPIDPLTALEPSKPGSRGRGRPRVNLVPEEPAEEPEKPDTDAENDTLTALEEGTEE